MLLQDLFKDFQPVKLIGERADFIRYEMSYSVTLTKEEGELLAKVLPKEYPLDPFEDYGATHFGTARGLYEVAAMHFRMQNPEHKIMRVVDWLVLCKVWAKSNSEEARTFAERFALKFMYSSSMEASWFFGDLGPLLDEETEQKMYTRFIAYMQSQQRQAYIRRSEG